MNYQLFYGQQEFPCELPTDLVVWQQLGPAALPQLTQAIASALAEPLDYPLLTQAVVPGDRVAIIVDPTTPAWQELAAAAGQQLQQAEVDAESIQIVLNQPVSAESLAAARSALIYPIIDYDTAADGQKVYLASTAEGERIYLPAVIAEADYTITLGQFGYDEHWGYRGTHSIVYPPFAPAEEQEKLLGSSQPQLTPEVSRGVRQQIDEIGWLLGTQYSIQVIPAGSGAAAFILCGASDSVYRRGVELLTEHWRSPLSQRAETVLISVPGHVETASWRELARACQVAGQLAVTEGRVILLTSLSSISPELTDLLAQCSSADLLLRKLKRLRTAEAVALHALVQLTLQAKVYLLSPLEPEVVENLYCIPLGDEAETCKALAGGESYAVLNGGQFAYVDV